MKDIEIAIEQLNNEGLTLSVVNGGQLIYSSKEKGIKPLYEAYALGVLNNSSVADKVTGKAAAMLCAGAGIKELQTNIISENAIIVLNNSNIKYEYSKCIPYIKNRDKTGMCPMETISLKSNSVDELLLGINNFFQNIQGV